jgi:hypothetical protein
MARDDTLTSSLSLEEQFSIASLNTLADQMSREQAIEMLKQVFLLYVTTRRLLLNEMANSLPQLAYDSNTRHPKEES